MLRSVIRLSRRAPVASARFVSSAPPEQSRGSAARALAWYSRQLEEKPLLTKSLTSFAIVGFGDVMCQVAVERVESFDWVRWLRAATLGAALVGPALHLWYNFIARAIPGVGLVPALKRLAVDQLVFAPLMIPIYMSSLMVLEGRAADISDKLRASYVTTLIANWQLWVPAQFITFRYVPLQYQVLWANFVSLAWNTYLSFAAHNAVGDSSHEEK